MISEDRVLLQAMTDRPARPDREHSLLIPQLDDDDCDNAGSFKAAMLKRRERTDVEGIYAHSVRFQPPGIVMLWMLLCAAR